LFIAAFDVLLPKEKKKTINDAIFTLWLHCSEFSARQISLYSIRLFIGWISIIFGDSFLKMSFVRRVFQINAEIGRASCRERV
jgi:hypothetical protein